MQPGTRWHHSQLELRRQTLPPLAELSRETQRVAAAVRMPDKKPHHLQPGFHTLNSTQFLASTPPLHSNEFADQLRHRTSRCACGQQISATLRIQQTHAKCYRI